MPPPPPDDHAHPDIAKPHIARIRQQLADPEDTP
jgi:hypothetical protein